MAGRPLVVVKVGGSLLGWPPLPARLGEYLEARAGDRIVVVVGGGPAADWIRDLDRLHGLGPGRSHALALRSLDLSAHVLSALLPTLAVVDSIASFGAIWEAGRLPLLAPRRFADGDDPLPHSWDVTTDTIAARLAARLGASELALLKSAPLPEGANPVEAARLGLVDRAFPEASKLLEVVTYVNLREEGSTWRTPALLGAGSPSAR